ncbi:MAG: hypothetical protein KTR32_09405 [Granulosicoccus sp.]|nr:hypothetical protein [Granulosicoccus sp.]
MEPAIVIARWTRRILCASILGFGSLAQAVDPNLTIATEQAPDMGCDSVLDGVFVKDPLTIFPGFNCIHYRITVTNTGSESAHSVVISDTTPAFTVYHAAASCSEPSCVITEPLVGTSGVIAGAIASMVPGQTVHLDFSVLIE